MFANRYQVQVGSRLYSVVDDLISSYQVLMVGRVTSTPSGAALLPAVQVDHPGVQVKAGRDGFFCLAAHVPLVFPDLDTTAYNLNLTLQAERHQPLSVPVSIPAGSAFPLPGLDLSLHYQPLRIQGWVTMGIGGAVVGLARVEIDQANLLTLRTPLHFDHPAGTPVSACTFASLGAARVLDQPAAFLATELRLDNSAGLLPGNVLRLGGEPDYEFMAVDSPGSQPGQVFLRGGLRRSYPAGTPVQAVTVTPGAAVALDRDASAGQGLLWLVSGLTASGIQVQDANPARVEQHVLGALSRDTAQDRGYYRIDGVVDLHAISLHAENPAATHFADQGWSIDPAQPVNTVNLRLFTP